MLCDKLAECSLNRRSTLAIDCINSVYANLLNSSICYLVDDLNSHCGNQRPKVLSNDQLPWVRLRKIWRPKPDHPEGIVDGWEGLENWPGTVFQMKLWEQSAQPWGAKDNIRSVPVRQCRRRERSFGNAYRIVTIKIPTVGILASEEEHLQPCSFWCSMI